ncbi:hypothetical protein BSYN_10090 [Bacteroides sedimenti]|uniref:Uncharacterized protein n=1 Tax=Bacteroides sedimenti TaxID=2136147 RepID=A0ABN6Z2I4_9BACE
MQGNDFKANGNIKLLRISGGNMSLLDNPVRKNAKIKSVILKELLLEGVFMYHKVTAIIAIM